MSDLQSRIAKLSPEKRALLNRFIEREGRSASRSTVDSDGILPVQDRDQLALSFAQERLWFVSHIQTGHTPYNNLLPLHIRGELDQGQLARALKEILSRHEVLRTTFAQTDGKPWQIINPPTPVVLPTTDLRQVEQARREQAIRETAERESDLPFDLSVGPLIRTHLLLLDDREHVLLLTLHHIVTDEWSTDILIRELAALYKAFAANQPSPLAPLPIQYADYAAWQREWLQGERLEAQLGYWRERLSGAPMLGLPTDHPRVQVQTFGGARINRVLPKSLSQEVKAMAKGQGVTLYILLLAAFVTLMHRLSGQQDIVVGSPVANRGRRELEGLIGFFVNTLALRADLSGEPTFTEVVARVRELVLGAYAHQELPFEKLIDDLKPERDLSRNPLFQVVFSVLNAPDALSEADPEALQMSLVPIALRTTRFDIECNALDTADGLLVRLVYNTDLFDATTIERLLAQYERVLASVVSNPDTKVSAIDLLGDAERQQLLESWNATTVPYPREGSVVSEFARQVTETPDAPAVEYEGESLSYRELDQRANQLAHWLRDRGVDRGSLVGLCMERSLDLVTGILGVMKAGAGYVPLDAEYPQERLAYMVSDTGVALVLCTRETQAAMSALDIQAINIQTKQPEIAQAPVEAPAVTLNGRDVAYIMYTSGSTGWPKGVVVEHRSVVRLVRGANYLTLGPGEVTLQLAPISFDASTLELWGSLLNGGALILYPRGVLSLSELGAFLDARGISVLWLTAALFHRMVDEELDSLQKVRQLLAGGEALSLNHVKRYLEALPQGHRLINGYGPTENTTFTCCHPMDRESELRDSVPIGRPIANTQVYVLDQERSLVPVGVVGELYAGGDGLARGYLNQPELTQEKFIPSPFTPGKRLYRTGDLVRWREEGVLEYVGRQDQQVKVRGYRIELGEIEHALSIQPAVREAVVICREDEPGDKRLVAYLVAEADAKVEISTLRAQLQARLPAYMVPSAIVQLEVLPLTPVGKVDREALPAPEGERQLEQTYVAPRSDLEQRIAAIWCEVLGLDQVGVDDNFFDLGGNSLLLMRLRSLLGGRLQQELPVTDLFGFPTIRTLAQHCAGQRVGKEDTAGQSGLSKVRERARMRRRTLCQRGQEGK